MSTKRIIERRLEIETDGDAFCGGHCRGIELDALGHVCCRFFGGLILGLSAHPDGIRVLRCEECRDAAHIE